MALNLNFNFGRLLQIGERLTIARVNAIVRGITATITGMVGKTDIAPGAIDATLVVPDEFFYTDTCVLVGTTYTVSGFPVDPPALKDGMVLYFKADATNAGAVNLLVNALGAHTITKYGGQPLVAGDILARQIVGVQYNTTLLGLPTWQMVDLPGNQSLPTSAPVSSTAKNLIVKNNVAASATKVDVTADEISLKSAGGDPYLATAVNVTADVGTNGANGLDTGAVAATTWYYIWVIYNPTTVTVAALLSLSATAPTLPAGYTFKALVGTVHAGIVGGSTTDFMPFYQLDKDVSLDDTVVFTDKTGVTAWTALSGADLTVFKALVPPIAKAASGNVGLSQNNNGGMAVAGDSSGLGATGVQGGTFGAALLGYLLMASWRCPMKTAQAVYYLMSNTTANTYRLSVSGYRL